MRADLTNTGENSKMEPTLKEKREVLRRAKALIKKGWCRFNLAQDRHGNSVRVISTDARYFCFSGSVQRAIYDVKKADPRRSFKAGLQGGLEGEFDRSLHLTITKIIVDSNPHVTGFAFYNDSYARTKNEILALFTNAQKQLRRRSETVKEKVK